MRPVVKSLTSIAAATASLAALQTTAGAGNLVLAASPNFGQAMQVSLTSGGNISAVNFTITGTDENGNVISEVMAGPNANTVNSVNYFKTVTNVAVSAAVGTNTSVGNTASSCSSDFVWDAVNSVANVGFACVVSSGATLTYKLQHSYDDPFVIGVRTWFDDATVTGKSANFDIGMTTPRRATRIVLTAWTSGTVTGSMVQGLEK